MMTTDKSIQKSVDLNTLLKRTCVLGAGGKMGRGIALLLLQEMALTEARQTGKVGSGDFQLLLVDNNMESLANIRSYFVAQLRKFAERNIQGLREVFAAREDLVDNAEMIDAFIDGAQNIFCCSANIPSTIDSTLIFEAIIENWRIKSKVLLNLKERCTAETTYWFTNTSSIPISCLDEAAELENRIIGFHFYNPPARQKLVETIASGMTDPALKELSKQLCKRLGKLQINSRDVAGFIGNGHFARDISYACSQFDRLCKEYTSEQAIYLMNSVSCDFLLRPMGIFQLVDYVGIDVCLKIFKVMEKHISGLSLNSTLLYQFAEVGIVGGQYGDGSQKDGIFQYKAGQATAVYSLEEGEYITLSKSWKKNCDAALGKVPNDELNWKNLCRDRQKTEKPVQHFEELQKLETLGATLAMDYMRTSKKVAEQLVFDKVAENSDDVNTVMITGFAHLYGPVNSYC